MSALFFGVATGTFMTAFINYKYNSSNWIKTKYLVWIGIITLVISIIPGWPDI